MYDLIIIGGGVSGFASGMYAKRFGLKTLLFTGEFKGGLITWAKEVCNYPGFKNISGYDLAKKIEEHAIEYGLEVKNEVVNKIEKKSNKFLVYNGNEKIEAKTIIFATGTEIKMLGVKGEKKLKNKGVHYCALCDAAFYRDKIVGVVGGSDSAAIEALILSDMAKKVYIIYRKKVIRAEEANKKALAGKDNIEIITNTNVVEIVGEEKLKKIKLDQPYSGKDELELDGLFISIGHKPNSQIAEKIGVELNEKGFIKSDKNAKTNVEGFFVAGDVSDKKFKQAIIGVAEGVTAAHSAYNFCKQNFK